MGNYDLAEREYSMAIIIKPSNAYYYLGRANLDAKNNHPDNAIADYSQFISMTEKLAVVARSSNRAVAFAYSGRARSHDMKG